MLDEGIQKQKGIGNVVFLQLGSAVVFRLYFILSEREQ